MTLITIITGEGKLDSQSLRGKVVIGIAERAKKQNKNVIAVVGGADDSEIDKAYEMGVTAVFPINRLPQDFSISRHHSKENLAYTVDNILRLLAAKKIVHDRGITRMNILKTVKKIPGGLMVVPLLLGAIINTFFGGTIWKMFDGTFTTYLWKSGAMPILAVFIFCNATTINFKKAGVTDLQSV